MPQCVVLSETGAVQASSADPCTGFVLLTPAEYGVVAANPFVLTVEDGILISGAVGAVWALAWALRSIRSVLSDGDQPST